MSVQMVCPSCGKRLKVPDAALGKKVRCSGCSEVVKAPIGGSSFQSKQNPSRRSNPSRTKKRKRPTDQGVPAYGSSRAEQGTDFAAAAADEYAAPATPPPMPPMPLALPSRSTRKGIAECNDCGGAVSKRAEVCPHCGAPVGASGFDVPERQGSHSRHRGRQGSDKSRVAYVVLGLFLGHLGIHNFYAGYTTKGIVQLLITLLTGIFIVPLFAVLIWVVVEVCTVAEDADGLRFS
jgi:TM2 domain-containing membrane protein YozV